MAMDLEAVKRFLERYARESEGADVVDAAKDFAAVFLAAGVQGAQAVRREEFAAVLPRRKQMFAAAGLQRTELTGAEVTVLSERYALARTRWRMVFARESEETLEVETVFLVDAGREPFEIVVYLACQDVAALMRERGWIA